MKKTNDIFCELACLTEQSKIFKGSDLLKIFFRQSDKRQLGQVLYKFIHYNQSLFDFLGVTPTIVGVDQDIGICFRTTSYVGTIPLRAPDTGKQIGDFVVVPRYLGRDRYANYIELLNLLEHVVCAEFRESLPLQSGYQFQSPLYFEAIQFVDCLIELSNTHWQKFCRLTTFSHVPSGNVDWNLYSRRHFRVEARQQFPTTKNVMTEIHEEYAQLYFVYNLCKNVINSSNTPVSTRLRLKKSLSMLDQKLSAHQPIETKSIVKRQSDLPVVRKCKDQANRILNFEKNIGTAWRVDFSDVFERFVQYLFSNLSKSVGGRFISNYKIGRSSKHNHAFELEYLEPDGIYLNKDCLIYVDAKYKSHLLNQHHYSEELKSVYRHDLHQVLAYTSFDTSEVKNAVICYPANDLSVTETKYMNRINHTEVRVKIVGIPLDATRCAEARNFLIDKVIFSN